MYLGQDYSQQSIMIIMQSTKMNENHKTNEKRCANNHSVKNKRLFSQQQKNDFINYATQMMDFYSISKP